MYPLRKIDTSHLSATESRALLKREWLVTNGIGGYASGTLSGRVSRRYHGLLIAALPEPHGRILMLNHLQETVWLPMGRSVQIGGTQPVQPGEETDAEHYLHEFRLEEGLPVWTFNVDGIIIEKRIFFSHGQNTVYVTFTLISDQESVKLELCPSMHFRHHEHSVDGPVTSAYLLSIQGDRYEISNGIYPPLRLRVQQSRSGFHYIPDQLIRIAYQHEADRGYASAGQLWTPGLFSIELRSGQTATLTATTEEWETVMEPAAALESSIERHRRLVTAAPLSAQQPPAADLVLAADQFIITPVGRKQDTARARAQGEEVRTIIAGYHWFTDWGRDTMISLEGLTLSTGRHLEARWILRTFGLYIRDGLIPNFVPDGETEGVYHTADATLWFFHAVNRYLEVTGDQGILDYLLPKLIEVVERHVSGTHYGIRVDPADGLLTQGAEGYQLTWMDAKVDGWVVTPRRGKAVEINALWYNALCLLAEWTETSQPDVSQQYWRRAEEVKTSFNQRFWSEENGCLLDVIDGENGTDSARRPNQIFAVSLPHAVLHESRWDAVLEKVKTELLTPVGLRSLAPGHPDYKPLYFGDLRARDAAYHQGTVWGWLIGPFIDAWLKVHPDEQEVARKWLQGLVAHLDDACVGSISEIFDAEKPFTARGCIAQAWSVAEALRCWIKTENPTPPTTPESDSEL
jgi:predicted glycogen debranching enzyme